MKHLLINLILTLSVSYVPCQLYAQNQDIQNIVNQVCGDSIFSHIALLQKMDRMYFNNDQESTDYLLSYLKKFEFDTSYLQEINEDIPADSGKYPPNVVAVKYGIFVPEIIHVIGAHYDAPWAFLFNGDSITARPCPGADDNASGTAGVLEAARILSDYNFKTTILFILFSGEETGMHGSEAVAEKAIREKWNFHAMLNMDMIAYSRDGDDIDVSIKRNAISEPIADVCETAINTYVPQLGYEFVFDDQGDHKSFWDLGLPAITFMDESDRESINFNHYIHTIEDTLGLSANSKILAELITKAMISTLILLDEAVTSIEEGSPAVQKVQEFTLLQNYPNPFNPGTTIEFTLPKTASLTLKIYNLLGEEVITLVSGKKSAGYYSAMWDAAGVSSGMYFCRMEAGDFVKVIKLLLVK